MQDESLSEVSLLLRNSQDKYVYFILAVVGTAIALSIKQTQDSIITFSQIPLAIAVLCWGFSFFFGCRYLHYVNAYLHLYLEILMVEGGFDKDNVEDSQHLEFKIKTMREILEENSNIANRFFHRQFRFLIVGALFYIFWHILEMWLRT